MRKLCWLFLVAAAAANAQALSVGVMGGAAFNDVVSSVSGSNLQPVVNSSNFTIGPSIRVNLPVNLRIEVDALYRPLWL